MKQLVELTVADYMTQQSTVIDDHAKLTQAIGLLVNERLAALPIVNIKREIIGILSLSDLVEIGHEIHTDMSALNYVTEKTQDFLLKMLIEQGDETLVTDVMTSPVEIVSPDTNLIQAAKKLVGKHYHFLPVVKEDGDLIGILSTPDFVRLFADYGDQVG